jgi:hypothetical protein
MGCVSTGSVAHAGVDRVAVSGERFGGEVADACAGAGDEDHGHEMLLVVAVRGHWRPGLVRPRRRWRR